MQSSTHGQALEGKTYSAGQTTDHNSTIVSLQGNLEDALPAPVVDNTNVNDPNLWGNAKSGSLSSISLRIDGICERRDRDGTCERRASRSPALRWHGAGRLESLWRNPGASRRITRRQRRRMPWAGWAQRCWEIHPGGDPHRPDPAGSRHCQARS